MAERNRDGPERNPHISFHFEGVNKRWSYLGPTSCGGAEATSPPTATVHFHHDVTSTPPRGKTTTTTSTPPTGKTPTTTTTTSTPPRASRLEVKPPPPPLHHLAVKPPLPPPQHHLEVKPTCSSGTSDSSLCSIDVKQVIL